ncbi:hypothetical protein HK098_004770 [Nowakowskiella sp. JEL0407]|nr:hypothetical protein HK098_004770 [Nowakowskiella sp. JEL0407]
MAPPVDLLRDQLLSNTPLKFLSHDQSPVPSLREASFLLFADSPVDLLAPAGFNDYSLLSVVFLQQNQTLDHANYLQQCLAFGNSIGKEVKGISFVDRKKLLDFLSRPVTTKRIADDSEESESKKLKIQDPVEVAFIEMMKTKERTLNLPNPTMFAKGTKNFAGIIKMGHEVFPKPGSKPPPKPNPTTQMPPPSSKSKPADPRVSLSKSRLSKNGKNDTSAIPIIIVPGGNHGPLNIWNVEEFLGENPKYVSPQERRQEKTVTGAPRIKPDEIILKRKPDKPGAPSEYKIIDSPATMLHNSDWPRVKAVFVMGEEWEFKGWKWKDPVDLFNNVKGFHLKFNDDVTKDTIKQWNVTPLTVKLGSETRFYCKT